MKGRYMIALLLAVLAAALLYIGMNPVGNGQNGEPDDQVQPRDQNQSERVSQQLVDIFPERIGYEWHYSGFAEYAHYMRLDNISGNTGNTEILVYEISGEVDDPSGGEAPGDFGLEMEYRITSDTVTESIIRGEKLIHVFEELQLLKLPLETGNRWEQTVETDEGEAVLTAEVLSAEPEEEEGPTVYRVRYSVPMEGMPDGVYIEERAFTEGVGVTYYARTLGDEYDFLFEYYIFYPDKQ
jgi:hypothetical protein